MPDEAALTDRDGSRQSEQPLLRRAAACRARATGVGNGVRVARRILRGARRARTGHALSRRGAASDAADQASETVGHGGSGRPRPARPDFLAAHSPRSIPNTADRPPEYSRSPSRIQPSAILNTADVQLEYSRRRRGASKGKFVCLGQVVNNAPNQLTCGAPQSPRLLPAYDESRNGDLCSAPRTLQCLVQVLPVSVGGHVTTLHTVPVARACHGASG